MRRMVPHNEWEQLKTRVSTAEGNIETIEGDIDTLEGNVEDINTALESKVEVDNGDFTIEVADWDENNQAVIQNELFQSANKIFVGCDGANGRTNYEAIANAKIIAEVSGDGEITLTAETVPTVDITITIIVFID